MIFTSGLHHLQGPTALRGDLLTTIPTSQEQLERCSSTELRILTEFPNHSPTSSLVTPRQISTGRSLYRRSEEEEEEELLRQQQHALRRIIIIPTPSLSSTTCQSSTRFPSPNRTLQSPSRLEVQNRTPQPSTSARELSPNGSQKRFEVAPNPPKTKSTTRSHQTRTRTLTMHHKKRRELFQIAAAMVLGR